MKRTIQILVVVLVLVGYTGFASGSEPFIKGKGEGSKEFVLIMDRFDYNNEKATISLKSLAGEVIYTEKLTGGAEYRKLFDVNALPEGEYVLEIEDASRTKAWSLIISDTGLEVDYGKEHTRFKPTLVQREDDKLGISLLNDKSSPVKMSIYDNENNQVFFSDDLGNDLIVQRMYDLSQLRGGKYTISVNVGYKTYNETISL